MMSIVYVFWMYVGIFGVIGAARGWAKELLVAFSVILALALIHLLRRYIPIVADLPDDSVELFWIQTLILGALVFFGYQTVLLVPHLQSKANRERLQDALFGAIVGAINGYLIAGTLLGALLVSLLWCLLQRLWRDHSAPSFGIRRPHPDAVYGHSLRRRRAPIAASGLGDFRSLGPV